MNVIAFYVCNLWSFNIQTFKFKALEIIEIIYTKESYWKIMEFPSHFQAHLA